MLLNFNKIADDFEVDAINNVLEEKPFLWEQIKARQEHPKSYYQDTRTIFLRWCQKMEFEAVLNDLVAVEYPAMQTFRPLTDNTIEKVMNFTDGEQLGRIILVELKPHGFIPTHDDVGAYADYYQRFHLCLKSQGQCAFTVQHDDRSGEYVHMAPGELWWFNHKKKHSVFNADDSPRVHMIFDIVSPKYKSIIEEESMGKK